MSSGTEAMERAKRKHLSNIKSQYIHISIRITEIKIAEEKKIIYYNLGGGSVSRS